LPARLLYWRNGGILAADRDAPQTEWIPLRQIWLWTKLYGFVEYMMSNGVTSYE